MGVPGNGNRPTVSFGCPGEICNQTMTGWMFNITENGQDFQMVTQSLNNNNKKNDKGITAKQDCCPVTELLENQIFWIW